MAGLCWMAVVLTFFLSAENSLAAVDQNRLAAFLDGILDEYKTQGMFSLAVSIPDNQNQDIKSILKRVFQHDPGNKVKRKINNDRVYVGNRVVAAKVLKRPRGGADHAESRVVDNLRRLFSSSRKNDSLLFYVYASPCVEKCSSRTHHESILKRINTIRKWNTYAVVFSKIFKPKSGPPNTEAEREKALLRLGRYKGSRGQVGLRNIFRCDGQFDGTQCTSCSSNGQVAHYCVSDTQPTSTSG